MNLVVGALVRAIQAARDDGWSQLSRMRLIDAARDAEAALRRRAVALASLKFASPALELSPEEIAFFDDFRQKLERRGARVESVARARGELAMSVRRRDGELRKVVVRALGAGWCAIAGTGTVVCAGDLAGRLSRAPLTAKEPAGDAPAHEVVDALSTRPARRRRGVGRPGPPPLRAPPNPRRL